MEQYPSFLRIMSVAPIEYFIPSSSLSYLRKLIIDAHTHLIDPPYSHEQLSFTISDGQVMQPESLRDQVTPNILLKDMDELHIVKSIVIASDALSNENLSKIVKSNSDKLRGFAYVHPLELDSTTQLENAVNRLGLVGLKLVPDFQDFSMGDPRIYPLLYKAVDLGVPVMVHSAPGLIKGHYNQSLPEHFDTITKEVSGLDLIISHFSYPLFTDLLNIVSKDGVYVDTSTTLPWIIDLYGIDFTSRYIKSIGVDSVIFGSDWWGVSSEMKKQVESIGKLNLTENEKNMILGGNISKLVNL